MLLFLTVYMIIGIIMAEIVQTIEWIRQRPPEYQALQYLVAVSLWPVVVGGVLLRMFDDGKK